MTTSFNIKDIDILKIRNTFPYWPSLIYGTLLIIIFIAFIDDFITKYIHAQEIRVLIYTTLVLGWYLFWQISRKKIKKNKKDKIGIIISIKTENDKQKVRLKEDFVKRLREFIDTHNLHSFINIVELNQFQTEKVSDLLYEYARTKKFTEKRWQNLLKKTKGHFFLYGNIKERRDPDKTYIFDLDAIVIHTELQNNKSNPIQKAFNDFWIKRVMFKESHELLGFQFTADVLILAVGYVIGIANFVSGGVVVSVKIHEEVLGAIEKFKSPAHYLINVKNELRKYLCLEYCILAKSFQIQGKKDEAWYNLSKALIYDPNDYEALILKSVFYFVLDDDPDKSITTCYQAKNFAKGNGTWKYNLAFLLMHKNRFGEALSWYDDIIKNTFDGEEITLSAVFQFNAELLNQNPMHIESYFIIGILKYYKSNNYPEAYEYLNNFINNAKGESKYEKLLKRTEKLINEVKKRLSIK